jgi:hypothetical protein
MKKLEIKYRKLIISIVFTLVIFILSLIFMETVTLSMGIKKLGLPLLRLLSFVFIGLIAGQFIEAMGWTHQVAVVARRLFKLSNLGNRCSAAFATAFVSGAAANAMLSDFYQEGRISKMQTAWH